MGLTILKKKPGYALGLLLIVIGAIMLLVLVWKAWQEGVLTSSKPLADLNTILWEKYPEIELWIGLRLVHYTVLGVVLLVVGCAILIARRERVPVAEEVTVLLECPRCKNQWRETTSKPHLKSMGYPEVRTLSRRKCSKCAKFIRPKIVATERKASL